MGFEILSFYLRSCAVVSCYAQVSEGGPGHHVFASAELGPREDPRPSGHPLHGSV